MKACMNEGMIKGPWIGGPWFGGDPWIGGATDRAPWIGDHVLDVVENPPEWDDSL